MVQWQAMHGMPVIFLFAISAPSGVASLLGGFNAYQVLQTGLWTPSKSLQSSSGCTHKDLEVKKKKKL